MAGLQLTALTCNAAAKDPEWIPTVAAQGWPIITRDTNIGVKRAEIEAIRDNGAAAVGFPRSSH